MRRFVLLFVLWLAGTLAGAARAQDNFLIVIADDLGTDRVGAYAENPDPGRTPNLDRLAAAGILYRNAWAYPMCSPTRSCLLTGLFGFRTGIGTIVHQGGGEEEFGLFTDYESLPDLLAATHASAVVGKWHLACPRQGPGHPGRLGFERWAVTRGNLGDYFGWNQNVGGTYLPITGYATTVVTDEAIRAIDALPEPWLLWVAYHAPHRPFHDPPSDLHGYVLPPNPEDDPVLAVKAAAEALDTELGRLFAHVDFGTTTVFFLGDNGTVEAAITSPQDPEHGKGSVYEGGVRVPFLVAGEHVTDPGRESDALVAAVDLPATLAEIAGVPHAPRDSISFYPTMQSAAAPSPREWNFSERFYPNGFGPYQFTRRAVRGPRYKLIRYDPGLPQTELFFDLEVDALETNDLLPGGLSPQEQQAYDELSSLLERLLAS